MCVCVHASGLKESKVQKKEQSVDKGFTKENKKGCTGKESAKRV